MNAVAHCVEAFWGPGATPVTDSAAGEGLRRLATGIRASLRAPHDPAARATALAGAWLAGEAFAAGGALHHKLCHVLGGMFDLPHAELHAALLPYTAAFLLPAVPEAGRRIAEALGGGDPAAGDRRAGPRRRHAPLARGARADRGRRGARRGGRGTRASRRASPADTGRARGPLAARRPGRSVLK